VRAQCLERDADRFSQGHSSPHEHYSLLLLRRGHA
jgi:hypothetical protein